MNKRYPKMNFHSVHVRPWQQCCENVMDAVTDLIREREREFPFSLFLTQYGKHSIQEITIIRYLKFRLFSDIRNSFTDIQYSFTDIRNSFTNIWNSFTDTLCTRPYVIVTDWLLSLTTAKILIPAWACAKVANNFCLDCGFC